MDRDNLNNIHDLLVEKLAPSQHSNFLFEGYDFDRQLDLNEIREALSNTNVVEAVSRILIEHQRAVRKHPNWPADTTHAVSIMAGKAGACLNAANHLREGRTTEGKDSHFMVAVEAIQTGAMAVRLLANHGLPCK